MRTMTVSRTVVLPDGKKNVFEHLKKMETLQNVSKPYASFERIMEQEEAVRPDHNEWQEAADYAFSLTVFHCLPVGIHRIHILHFDADEISTLEGNEKVPIWNHRIILQPVTDESCIYTDELEIGAGMPTALVCLWAKLYLRHRQRKWVKLLRKSKKTDSFG